ncbi:MAG: putative cell division FtsK/SpoIIIE [Parcubacteria group bacterium Gr01-1014_30]|nr:MAG: putative cell division FtsK/SpoIIIE [Parcubacteria group bacterium Gr01-1014_30]
MSKNRKKNKNSRFKKEKQPRVWLPDASKKYVFGTAVILLAVIVSLSFFERSGPAGQWLKNGLLFLIGNTIFAFPLLFLFSGLISFRPRYRNFFYSLFLANFTFVLGISGILEGLNPGQMQGGWLGYLAAWPLLALFDFLVTQVIFVALVCLGFLIFWHLLPPTKILARMKEKITPSDLPASEGRERLEFGEAGGKPSLVSRVLQKVTRAPRFTVREVPSGQGKLPAESATKEGVLPAALKAKVVLPQALYSFPPKDLLERDGGKATPGDVRTSASIIKKTLQNFGIAVEMSEVNVGPTVTQYTLKPAEGIKLSKITALSNDLALALAAHPIRIEAPIPGKSLVGIEVPNKVRARVGLREMVESQEFQTSPPLTVVLGKDVSGNPKFADLAKMPHLLVAGSTGTGKTVYLNNVLLSLIYKNSPEALRFILIDPKRVEFSIYEGLPHLLAPVIFDANQTVNVLRWLIGEMERRFDMLSVSKTRDIASFNSKAENRADLLSYIVLVIDELADLMAAKGREVESGIVRLAQMARAVGIHLVVATQRPSVEVITGLIKANITSRITFQVASQVDSRTVLDSSGAEKLLGSGDLLYLSPEIGKPKRIQSAFVSEKEVKKVVNWLKTQIPKAKTKNLEEEILENHLTQDLRRQIESLPEENSEGNALSQDPLYEEAKKEVILAGKASASLLQRRLRIGYARAARLIDIMEERGVVGPGEGAKPREVYINGNKEDDEWQKV